MKLTGDIMTRSNIEYIKRIEQHNKPTKYQTKFPAKKYLPDDVVASIPDTSESRIELYLNDDYEIQQLETFLEKLSELCEEHGFVKTIDLRGRE